MVQWTDVLHQFSKTKCINLLNGWWCFLWSLVFSFSLMRIWATLLSWDQILLLQVCCAPVFLTTHDGQTSDWVALTEQSENFNISAVQLIPAVCAGIIMRTEAFNQHQAWEQTNCDDTHIYNWVHSIRVSVIQNYRLLKMKTFFYFKINSVKSGESLHMRYKCCL